MKSHTRGGSAAPPPSEEVLSPEGLPWQEHGLARLACHAIPTGGWVLELPARNFLWSEAAASILDWEPPGAAAIDAFVASYVPESGSRVYEALLACIESGTSFDVEGEFWTAKDRRIWVRLFGEAASSGSPGPNRVHGALQDLSAQKYATEQLVKSSRRLHDTLENVSDAFFTVDTAWRFTYLNPAAERLLNRQRSELLGKNLWEQFPEAVGTPSDHEYRRALREGATVRFEQYYPPLGRWFAAEAHPSPEGLAVYFRDITERKARMDALAESEERFRLLANASNDAIWDWDLETDLVWWNTGFTELFGVPAAELEPTSESWTSRIHDDDRGQVVASIQKAIEGGEVGWSCEYRFRRHDESFAYVLDRGHIIRDVAGKAVRMLGGMTDWTERKQAEERIVEQAALLDSAHDAILVRDLGHCVQYWNRSAERLYGWTASEVLGKSVVELLYADPLQFHAAMAKTLECGEWRGELEQITKDLRSLIVECHWTVVLGEGKKPKSILAINTDVTQRKRLEAQFLRAQRMESLGAMAGGIAHDLNNTLAPILLTVSSLQHQDLSPTLRADIEAIHLAAKRGADMVQQLLSFARGNDETRTEVNLAHSIAEVRTILKDTFPKDIHIESLAEDDLWRISADPTQIHQLLMNLCVNARDAMPSGGTLTLAVQSVVLDEVYAGMSLEAQPGPYVLIRVEDTGTGMPQEVVERIFEPFFSTKEAGTGTGLGLSTAHAIVRNHHGFIHVYSEPGIGTRFKIYLPANVSLASSQPPSVLAPLPRGNGELILVVEDEEAVRQATERTLERYGYRVLVAENGAEGLSVYAQRRTEIAVVLTDMSMPIMDGPAMIVALKFMNPAVRVIGSSGLSANGHIAKAAGAGVQHFIPKPYTAEAILKALQLILKDAE